MINMTFVRNTNVSQYTKIGTRLINEPQPEYAGLTAAWLYTPLAVVMTYISREIGFSGTCIALMYEFDLLFVLGVYGVVVFVLIDGVKLIKVCPTSSADLYVFVLSFLYYYYSSLIGFLIRQLCHFLSNLSQIWNADRS